jgi:hypothetical protein
VITEPGDGKLHIRSISAAAPDAGNRSGKHGPIFVVRLEPVGELNVHALRAVLKALLRRHGLRCIEMRDFFSGHRNGS